MTPATTPTLKLKNGVTMPALGLGEFQSPPEDTVTAVENALRGGYRLIDTAAAYGNEREVGEANFDVFDFTLTAEEIAAIDALDPGVRGGPDPELLNTETYPLVVDNS